MSVVASSSDNFLTLGLPLSWKDPVPSLSPLLQRKPRVQDLRKEEAMSVVPLYYCIISESIEQCCKETNKQKLPSFLIFDTRPSYNCQKSVHTYLLELLFSIT